MRTFIRRAKLSSLRGDDEGSGLIMVFMVMLISSALSLVLLENAVGMAKQTQANNKRITSLAAAQAGLDSALGQVRNAVDATGTGDVTQIPCSVAPGLVGGIGSPTEGTLGGNYTVRLTYYSVDPSAQSEAWRANSANQINCPSGSHPDKVPAYALVDATGTASGAKPRSIETTYIFTTSNKNIAGGLIHVEGGGQTGIPDLCPDAGSAHPNVGDAVTMMPCDINDLGQRWAYQTDLTFLLTATANDAAPKGPMCMSAAGNPASTGTAIKMVYCTGQPTAGSATLDQQYSYDDNGRFENTKLNTSTGKRTLAGTCMNVTTANTAGSGLQIGSCGQTWRPEASVGAGMAGAATRQLVNYKEFGRCLDATNQNPNYSFMIAYPCKQSPDPSALTWNQLYTYTASTGQLSTLDTADGNTYCLTSPLAAEPDMNTAQNFVVLKKCTSPLQTGMKWVEIGNSTGNYITDYTIHDASNPSLCLGVGITGTGVPSASGLGEWSSIYVQACDGSLGQKWNAPPNIPTGTTTDTHETGTSGG